MISYDTTSEAYLGTLADLMKSWEHVSHPRGQKVYEMLHYQFRVMFPTSKVIETRDEKRNEVIADYTIKEFALYLRGETRAEEFAKASGFWAKLANPDGTINSAYGHLVFKDESCGNFITQTPWNWAKNAIINDNDTRQAIVKFHKRSHLWVGNKDQVCTIYSNFHLRSGKLHMVTHMRSQDIVLGMVYDLPWFVYMQERMAKELRECGIAAEVGTYTHSIDSLHAYDRDMSKIVGMLGYDPKAGELALPGFD